MKNLAERWNKADIHLRYFLVGVLLLGITSGILSTTFSNYLNDIFHLDETQRTALEFPREFPGFMLFAVTGLLASYSIRSWAVLVGILSGIGIFGLGYLSPSYVVMGIWMVVGSMGDHLYMPVENTMGLHLAREGKQGRRLGQITGAKNLAMIAGALLVYVAAKSFSGALLYKVLFLVAAIAAFASGFAFWKVNVKADREKKKTRFVLRKKYTLFYILNILFGARKQIFLTFAPWVLVKEYHVTPDTMAVLIMIASIAGVVFRQAFGIAVDRFGEKKVFIADALILFGICAGFALSKNVYLLFFLFIFDNLMFSTRIARTTYLNKIAHNKSDIAATISLGITMDHVVSMTLPALGGILWLAHGYQSVFVAASAIAVLSLVAGLAVKVPVDSLVEK